MDRTEMTEIVREVIERLQQLDHDETPNPACIYGDAPNPCDVTTFYGMNEEG